MSRVQPAKDAKQMKDKASISHDEAKTGTSTGSLY